MAGMSLITSDAAVCQYGFVAIQKPMAVLQALRV